MTEATATGRYSDAGNFEAVAEQVPTMIFRTDMSGELTFANELWTAFTGRAVGEERGAGWMEGVHPDDLEAVQTTFARALETQGPFSTVFRIRRHDGSSRRVLCQGGPVKGPDGRFGGHACSCVEVEAIEGARPAGRKEVVDEINHRVKNALFSVQALARQTIWGTRELERAYERFAERLVALARAHDLLMDEDWRGVSIHELVRQVAKPYGREGSEFALRGEAVQVAPQLSLSLALCLQELFANAGKVGALAAKDGKVMIDWIAAGTKQEPRLQMFWRESGVGARPEASEVAGFGTALIRVSGNPQSEGGMGGGDGVTCLLEFPVLSSEGGRPDASGAAGRGRCAGGDVDARHAHPSGLVGLRASREPERGSSRLGGVVQHRLARRQSRWRDVLSDRGRAGRAGRALCLHHRLRGDRPRPRGSPGSGAVQALHRHDAVEGDRGSGGPDGGALTRGAA